jgi:hypothetical protein
MGDETGSKIYFRRVTGTFRNDYSSCFWAALLVRVLTLHRLFEHPFFVQSFFTSKRAASSLLPRSFCMLIREQKLRIQLHCFNIVR